MLDDVADDGIARIALELRRPVDLGPEVDRAVMAALRAAPLMVAGRGEPARATRRRGLGWLLRPRTVRLRVSPFGALAAAGIAIAAVLGLRREVERSRVADPSRTGEFPVAGVTGEHRASQASLAQRTRDTVYIQRFVFVAPAAKQVALAGAFNGWDTSATPLVKDATHGVWTVDVPLAPGRYEYAFVVDGERWAADPGAPRAIVSDFGRPSSVVTVREARSL